MKCAAIILIYCMSPSIGVDSKDKDMQQFKVLQRPLRV
ncbi:hypothetical protein SJ05684_c16230 [Sinorhizobium sojae CCBAU 05684]|uniref:Uncharacterized protein n=1 Tax=Sinorhizobium sojae CCBAU 05684 TaxID=716928 RepID=A0A249PBB8_9HYPH|nr:hypothetical protein SJ05684_c16230 [Sinorhizobium sojae CCBAU 05684]